MPNFLLTCLKTSWNLILKYINLVELMELKFVVGIPFLLDAVNKKNGFVALVFHSTFSVHKMQLLEQLLVCNGFC